MLRASWCMHDYARLVSSGEGDRKFGGLQADYARDGAVVVRGLFNPERCQHLKEEAAQLLLTHAPHHTVLVGLSVHSAAFRELHADGRLLTVLRRLMPQGVAFLSDKAVFKSRRHPFATPLHVDAAYWPRTRPKLSVWLALEEATQANGCLLAVPGSHREHHAHGSGNLAQTNGEFYQVVTASSLRARALPVPMATGDVLIFGDEVVHGSCANDSGEDRYGAILTYHAPGPDESFDLAFPARRTLLLAAPAVAS
jgi:hypothetical protein